MKKARVIVLALSLLSQACSTSNGSTEVLNPPADFAAAPRISSPSQQPRLIRRRAPVAPRELTDISASALADIYVSAGGDVVGTRYISGNRTLFGALAVAASDWKFEPFKVEGHATPFVLPLSIALTWQPGAIRAGITMKVAGDAPPN
jgi:hypothetical protein